MMLLIQNIHVFDPEYQGVKDVLITGNTIHKIADSLPVTAAYEKHRWNRKVPDSRLD